MPYWYFQLANFSSALVWCATLLLVGDIISEAAEWIWKAM
jgi:membrane protein DedA with SNARE-associated domain